MTLRAYPIRRTATRLLLALAALLAALTIASPSARAATPASYDAVVAQVKQGPVVRAVINPPLRHVEIKFRNQSEWKATYPSGAEAQLRGLLHSRNIPVVFASHHRRQQKPAVHHHLRYIAAGILAAVLLAVGLVLAVNARSRRRSEPEPQAPPG